nr:hypothetical protein [Pseudomonas mosselii]
MAVRKKSETIHLRVSPFSKLLLEGLASASKRTSTQVIEDLLLDAAQKLEVNNDGVISSDVLDIPRLDLHTAVSLAYVEGQPLLTKLRQWHLADTTLSQHDFRIISEIVLNRSYFDGDTILFPEGDKLLAPEEVPSIEKVNLEKIESNWPMLEAYVKFRDSNPKWKPNFKAFVEMTGSDS